MCIFSNEAASIVKSMMYSKPKSLRANPREFEI